MPRDRAFKERGGSSRPERSADPAGSADRSEADDRVAIDFSRQEPLPGGRVFAAADFDGDGAVDLVGRGAHRNDRQLLWNDGSGEFEVEQLPSHPAWSHPIAADLDGHGDNDLIGTGGVPTGSVLVRNDGPSGSWFVDSLPEVGVSLGVVAVDLNGDGRLDLAIPRSSGRRLSVFMNRTSPSPSPDENRDGVPDACAPAEVRFLRGDCDSDGNVGGQVTDALFLLNYNFVAGREPACLAACDSNGDGDVLGAITDALYLLTFSFLGGPPPAAPFPDCGTSDLPADEALGCEGTPVHCQ